jgi:hypothetical protein
MLEDPSCTPCETGCPLQMKIPQFLQLYKENRLEDAFLSLIFDNPLPASTGRLCQHSCENQCRRISVDESINIREVHRVIADAVYQDATKFREMKERVAAKRLPATGYKIAVWGAGPGGLTAAFYLALLGHDVTVYEAHSEAGGTLRSMPEYRLPKTILQKEIELIEQLGVNFVFSARPGIEMPFEEIGRHCNALFLSVGARKDVKLSVGRNGFVMMDREDVANARPGVLAGADGPSKLANRRLDGSIVGSMGYGKRAALNIDQRLTGEQRSERIQLHFDIDPTPPLTPVDIQRWNAELVASETARGLREVNLGLSDEQARQEASRCLRCDTRVTYGTLGVPTAMEAPSAEVLIVTDPFPEGPYGAKGISEIAVVPSTPAILNAIYNATGVRGYKLPIDKKLLQQAMNAAEAAGAK